MNDKLKHFLVCMGISWAVLVLSHLWFPIHYNYDLGLAFIVSVFCAGAKELIWDKWLKLGTPDYYDFFWGVFGAVVGPAVWLVMEMILGVAEPLPW
jgi:hypothetical protein